MVKTCLQHTLAAWGCPEQIRMDNGSPWGNHARLPSALGLWLVGLGITPIFSRPARSTDNAIVERDHGILARWIAPHTCHDFQHCQDWLAWAAHTQRERYRMPQGYTRTQAYPDLYHNPRSYHPAEEAQHWQLERVAQYLATYVFKRKVERNGRLTLFANTYTIGQAYARQYMDIRLDSLAGEWVFLDEYAQEVRRHPSRELSYELISQLKLAKRRRN